jgi:hypothetical protein
MISRSRDTLRPSYAGNFRPLRAEGAGNAGCPMHPQPGVRWGSEVCTPVFTAEAPETSGIPHAMVGTGSFALSPVTSSFLPPSPHGLNGFTCPVGPPKPPRGLASATDARTTRLRRTQQCRSSCAFADRSRENPPCDPVSRATLPRPPHPALNVRDDREAPLLRARDGDKISTISDFQKEKYFAWQLKNPKQLESSREIRFFAHAFSVVRRPERHMDFY